MLKKMLHKALIKISKCKGKKNKIKMLDSKLNKLLALIQTFRCPKNKKHRLSRIT